jgi:SH3 domain-containing YSC84-like protein 1
MFQRFFSMLAVVLLAGCATPTTSPLDTANSLVVDAVETLADFRNHKNLKEYVTHLDDAAGVVILPDVVKAGWFLGAEAGNGVLLAKQAGGGWSDPTFHTLAAASFGLQIGIQDTSVLLIIRNEKALNSILKHQGKLGADIGATMVYAGVGMEAATTSNLGADILAFAAPVLGAYIGSSLEGSVLAVRRDLNEAVYGTGATADAILAGKFKTTIAKPLQDALGR